jgi:hypothetical protein
MNPANPQNFESKNLGWGQSSSFLKTKCCDYKGHENNNKILCNKTNLTNINIVLH